MKNADGFYEVPEDKTIKMEIPTDMIPKCPVDGSPVTTNLRADDKFVEDDGWHKASVAYADFLRRHESLHVLYFELGLGSNTPIIIKYPFWQMTADNPKAVYACLNYGESYCPMDIEKQSICIDGDIDEFQPANQFSMGGNKIAVCSLDLNVSFAEISARLEQIVEDYFEEAV